MLETLSVAGVVVVAILVFLFFKTRRQDQISEMLEKRRGSARVVSKADFASGMERLPVALALTDQHLYYENPDLQADLDLGRLEEIEYDDELTTGHSVEQNERVLRVRSHGTAFEFVLPTSEVAKWQAALPPKRTGQPAARVG